MKLKVIFGSLFFILYSLFFISPAHAQFSPGNGANYLNTNPDVPQNFSTYTQSVFIEIAAAAACQIAGFNPISKNAKCLGVDSETGKIGFIENGGGLIGITGNMIAATFEIPLSSTHYAKYLADNFGVAKKTQAAKQIGSGPGGFDGGAAEGSFCEATGECAFGLTCEIVDTVGEGGICRKQPSDTNSQALQGTGFQGLSRIVSLWIVFRNMIYFFFVLIFVIIGLGIMFRVKIDPRTVMTIQNQIPKIVVALVLVTFSFAIAGFLIDLMYVFLFLIYNLVASSNLADLSSFKPETIQGSNPISAVGFLGGFNIVKDASFGLGGIIASLFDGTLGRVIAGLIGAMIGGAAGSLIPIPGANLLTGAIGGALGGSIMGSKLFGIIGGLIAFIVIAAAVLIALFRLWFQLIKAYVFILINTVLAPFWIAGGLIPGSPINFGAWFRDIVGNLSAFPTTLLLFLLGKIFIEEFGKGGGGNFAPPFVGNPGNQNVFGALIGLGIILLTPQVVNLVRQTLKAPEMKITTAVGQSVSAGTGVFSAPERLGRMGMSIYYMKQVPGLQGLLGRIGRGGGGGGGGGHP